MKDGFSIKEQKTNLTTSSGNLGLRGPFMSHSQRTVITPLDVWLKRDPLLLFFGKGNYSSPLGPNCELFA